MVERDEILAEMELLKIEINTLTTLFWVVIMGGIYLFLWRGENLLSMNGTGAGIFLILLGVYSNARSKQYLNLASKL